MNNYYYLIIRANQSTHLRVVVTSLIVGIVVAAVGINLSAT